MAGQFENDCRKTQFPGQQFTKLQGQYFPAEADFRRYFDVTPPTVHNMIVALERHGFIKRTPGLRSIVTTKPDATDLDVMVMVADGRIWPAATISCDTIGHERQ